MPSPAGAVLCEGPRPVEDPPASLEVETHGPSDASLATATNMPVKFPDATTHGQEGLTRNSLDSGKALDGVPRAVTPPDAVRETALANQDSSRVSLSPTRDVPLQNQPRHISVETTVARHLSQTGSSGQSAPECERSHAAGPRDVQLVPHDQTVQSKPHFPPPATHTGVSGHSDTAVTSRVGSEASSVNALASAAEEGGFTVVHAQVSAPNRRLARPTNLNPDVSNQRVYRAVGGRSLLASTHVPTSDVRTPLEAPHNGQADTDRVVVQETRWPAFKGSALESPDASRPAVVTASENVASAECSRSTSFSGDMELHGPLARAQTPVSIDLARNRADMGGPASGDSVEVEGADVGGLRRGQQSVESVSIRTRPAGEVIESRDALKGKPLNAAHRSSRVDVAAAGSQSKPVQVLGDAEPNRSVDWTSPATGPSTVYHGLADSGVVAERPAFPPGAADQTTLARWGTASQIGDSIAAWYATSPRETNARLEVQLNPPELGRVVVRLEKARGKVGARLVVSNETARIAIERELPAIQQSLEEAGVNLDEFDVTQHGNHQRDERPDEETFPAFRWSEGRQPHASPSVPDQVGDGTAGQVDVKV